MNEKGDIEAPSSLRLRRVVLPIILGVVAVTFLLARQFDWKEFEQIEWNGTNWFWFAMAVFFLVVRHLAYATRLYVLSDRKFSFLKSIELIFLWEFSSAVSPTSVGGSAVALFALSQENLPTSKTTAIVIYTVVLDTLFFVTTIPMLLFLFGPGVIYPGIESLFPLTEEASLFFLFYAVMILYGAFFYYGLFLRPQHGRNLLFWLSNRKLLKRWRESIRSLGNGFVQASKEMWYRPKSFHIKAFLSTAMAWSMRFLVINCLIIAIVPGVSKLLTDQVNIFARLESMFVILLFSPTPGGAGFYEITFGRFMSDYIPLGIAAIVALVWRLLTYYSYLLAGIFVIPNWSRKIIAQRNQKKAVSNTVGED